MKRVRITVSLGLIGCDRKEVIEVEDDEAEDEDTLDEIVREAVLSGSMVNWSHEVLPE